MEGGCLHQHQRRHGERLTCQLAKMREHPLLHRLKRLFGLASESALNIEGYLSVEDCLRQFWNDNRLTVC